MKWLPGFLPSLLFIFLPYASYAQDVEIQVIRDQIADGIMWPVDSSSRARREDWWLINRSGDNEGAIRVTVIFHQPYCDKQDIEVCDAFSQKVEVRAVDDGNKELPPPYYLAKGNLAWQKARQVSLPGQFDLRFDLSEIEVSMNGLDYVLSRALVDDKYRVTVSVRSGTIEQEVYSCKTSGPSYPYCGDEGFEEIHWAGDLDGDGKLDFLAQFTEKYSMRHYYLYISGNAADGRLVALSAEHEFYGD